MVSITGYLVETENNSDRQLLLLSVRVLLKDLVLESLVRDLGEMAEVNVLPKVIQHFGRQLVVIQLRAAFVGQIRGTQDAERAGTTQKRLQFLALDDSIACR